MSEGKSKKRLLTRFEKILLAIAIIIVLYFIIAKLGINIGTVTDDTQIIDPYK